MTNPTGHSVLADPKPVLIPAQPVTAAGEFTLDQVDPLGDIQVMLVSKPGGGKTVAAATFPPPFRWVAADGQNALKSVVWAFKAGLTSMTDPKQLVGYAPVEIPDKGTYVANPRAFNDMCDHVDRWFQKGEIDKWRGGTLVLDSMTTINGWAMNLGLVVNKKFPSESKPLSGSHAINEKAKARIVTGQQDYKTSMAHVEGWLQDLRASCMKEKVNLVILCHEMAETDDDGNVLTYLPMLDGQLRTRVPKDLDDVWWVVAYNGKDFKFQVHSDPKHPAKTRWGQCLNREEPADFRLLLKKVKEFHGIK